jgi:hypothetical protein
MPTFAANLSMMFTECEFLDRFAAAADAGFTAVEYLFPYAHKPEEIAIRLQRHNLTQALIEAWLQLPFALKSFVPLLPWHCHMPKQRESNACT